MKKLLTIIVLFVTGILLVSCNNQLSSGPDRQGKGMGRGGKGGDISDIVRLKDHGGNDKTGGNFGSGSRMGNGNFGRFGSGTNFPNGERLFLSGSIENILSKLSEEDKQKFSDAIESRKKADATIKELRDKYPDVFSGGVMMGSGKPK